MPHEPPPPHADGRNTLLLASVESSVPPLSAMSTFSPPLMSMVTSPEVVSFAFAKRSNPTRTRVITRKATIAMIIVNVIFLSLLKDYNLIPEKIMNAMPIRPVMMKAIPGPRSAAGICE